MQQALVLAARGQGYVEPNPMVGCLLVRDGELLGQGYHARFGGPHAERAAIEDARQAGRAERLAGATAYVTLEPCCHHGKTPPCTEALIACGIARVVTAMLDPFEQVSGQGIKQLKSAGIEVLTGVGEGDARALNAPYLKRILCQRPWVIAKWAMSLDGKLATRENHSQWISNEISRSKVQELRGRVDAILVGSGTALADDPRLVARTPQAPQRTALRVVADSTLQLSPTSQLASTAHSTPVLLWAGPEASESKALRLRELGCQVHRSQAMLPLPRLDELLQTLVSQYNVTNLLVEGGGRLLGSLLELKQIDQCEVFIAPKIIGGQAAVTPVMGLGFATVDESPGYSDLRFEACGCDMHISIRLQW
jgi:diaminohydroxyphosphoribosylaminopyrimidine deaminase/5-amino-6-(5-phosphoribosylamino)uracil reductase